MTVAKDAAGNPVLTITGEIDIANADSLSQVIDRIVAGAPTRLVLDLGSLQFMDSSGIAVLARAAHQVDEIELLHASPIIRRIIEATGLADILTLGPS